MTLSVKQILKPPTEDQVLAFITDSLTSIGFRGTSWQDGSVQLNWLRAFARSGAGFGQSVSNMAYNMLENPNGGWLDLIGKTIYRLDRDLGVKAKRFITLTNPRSGVTQTIQPLDIVIAGKTRFQVTGGAPFTLNPNDPPHDFEVTAEQVGEAGNSGIPPRIAGHAGLIASWSTATPLALGAEIETDSRYWTRCMLRWAELGPFPSLRAYEFWALTAAPSVKRVKAINLTPPNSIYIALDPGTPTEIAEVLAYIAAGGGKNAPNDIVTAGAANVIPQTVKARPRVNSGTTVLDCTNALDVVFNGLQIGGDLISGSNVGRLLVEKLAAALAPFHKGYGSAGIVTPAADIVMGSTDIITPTYDIALEFI